MSGMGKKKKDQSLTGQQFYNHTIWWQEAFFANSIDTHSSHGRLLFLLHSNDILQMSDPLEDYY